MVHVSQACARPTGGRRLRARPTLLAAGLALGLVSAGAAQDRDIPRTPSGRPDLSGTYDIATLTPVERSDMLRDRVALTDDEVDRLTEAVRQQIALADQPSDPNRGAPPAGVPRLGGNAFWVEPATRVSRVDGEWRTSIIVDPPDGRFPPRVAEAPPPDRRGPGGRRRDEGIAYWLADGPDAPGPYDDMEQRSYTERCLVGRSSGPPMLAGLANNHKRLVLTEDTLVILNETSHDARIVRIGGSHDPPALTKWLGDSVGWWEGDVLVVETTNFVDRPAFRGGSGEMTVIEEFRLQAPDSLVYGFVVDDPIVWTAPFAGEYEWRRSDGRLYEHACHEGNLPLAGIMRGARVLEAIFRGEEVGGIANPTR